MKKIFVAILAAFLVSCSPPTPTPELPEQFHAQQDYESCERQPALAWCKIACDKTPTLKWCK